MRAAALPLLRRGPVPPPRRCSSAAAAPGGTAPAAPRGDWRRGLSPSAADCVERKLSSTRPEIAAHIQMMLTLHWTGLRLRRTLNEYCADPAKLARLRAEVQTSQDFDAVLIVLERFDQHLEAEAQRRKPELASILGNWQAYSRAKMRGEKIPTM
eukprot:TRINITY_DN30303_c0_g1_i1.p2 TRINITY_DN30303_c0_g1~~TRINITY_DN30303_c0_g1_i1.p2  ORF type:complete len:178 (+),score=68.01 TRINITY_DN30303_c0_g1_i1:70-534(+)